MCVCVSLPCVLPGRYIRRAQTTAAFVCVYVVCGGVLSGAGAVSSGPVRSGPVRCGGMRRPCWCLKGEGSHGSGGVLARWWPAKGTPLSTCGVRMDES